MTLEDIIEKFIGYEDRRLLHTILLELHFIKEQNKRIIMTNEELAQGLADLGTQLAKVNTEITGKLKDLEDAIANADNVPDSVVTAFNALKPAVQTLDDLVPDAPAPVPAPTV